MLLLILKEVEGVIELTAGCLAPDRIEELFSEESLARAPIEPPIREAPLERAAGCWAPLGTDGLVVLIFLPIREVILGLILLLVLVVVRFVIVFRDLLFVWLFVLLEEFERLLDGADGPIELTIRDVMLGLILLLVFLVERFVITLLELRKFKLLLLVLLTLDLPLLELLTLDVPLLELLLFVIALLELLLLDGVLVVIVLPIREVMLELILLFELFRLVELGTDVRELIDRLDVILLGARLVIALLDVFLLVARFVITLLELEVFLFVMALLDVLLLGARLVIVLLDVLLLGARLVTARLDVFLLGAERVMLLLELRLDETLLDRLDDLLDDDLAAEDDLEDDRLELLDLLLERVLAANTGSQNNKRAKNTQKTRKKEPSRRGSEILTFDF